MRRRSVLLSAVTGALTGALTLGRSHGGRAATDAQASSSLAVNTDLIRQFFDEAVNHGEADLVDKVYAATFVDRSARADHVVGRAGVMQWITDLHSQFPGIRATVEDTIAEGDLVATRVTWRGTHPPAGTHLVGKTLHLFRITDGQIVEAWSAGWEWLATV